MKVQHTDEEVIYVEQHEPEAFHEILGAHHKHDLFFCRQSKLAHTLYIAGRHIMILTITIKQQILQCTEYAELMALTYLLST